MAASSLIPRAAVLRMDPYHPPTGGRRNKLRLDFNENLVGSSPRVLDLLQRYVTAADLAIYPEYDHALEELATYFSVATQQLTLTNGTDEAIHLLINTYVNQGDEVIVLKPSYAMYRFYSQLAGAAIAEIPYRPETLAFPLEELLDQITNSTRAILISNPNNPTGTGTTVQAIERILARAVNAAVLVDEAYYEFSGITVLPLITEYPNLFVSRTFSKAFGMAALRCGCLFSHSFNITQIKKAQPPSSVNSLAVMAARVAITDREFTDNYVKEVLAARELLYAGLKRLAIPHFDSQANFVLFQAGSRAREVCEKLRTRGLLVRDRSYEIPGCVRVTIGTRDHVKYFLEELQQIW
ncbi:MAG: histidinol-phosphate transaminase [Acidobacteriaceae bacterium]|nr:histidinol-phosphate transaminase [Acidobacteriaceae bacterium]MBV9781679.1 histidinol-phosphate transaminase [Acidobacteriaceae bacterium]